MNNTGLHRWLSGTVSTCLCGRLSFNLWVRKIPWRMKRQPTPEFLPGERHGQRSLAGYSPWDDKELDMTEQLNNINNYYKILAIHLRFVFNSLCPELVGALKF